MGKRKQRRDVEVIFNRVGNISLMLDFNVDYGPGGETINAAYVLSHADCWRLISELRAALAEQSASADRIIKAT